MQSGNHITRQKCSLLITAGIWMLMAGKIAAIQVFEHGRLHDSATSQREQEVTLRGSRGRILDRNGTELAVNLDSFSYGLRSNKVNNNAQTVSFIAKATDISAGRIRSMVESKKSFQWLVRQSDSETAGRLDALKLPCLEKFSEPRRCYPLGMVGAQLIGYTDIDGKGIEGCEFFLDDTLVGRDGRSVVLRDGRTRSIQSFDKPEIAPQNGGEVTLTIDWRIQEIAEEELEAGVTKYDAVSGGAIVLDTETGEILAMANAPRFDPNNIDASGSPRPEFRKNRLSTDMLEPGSTFKIVTFIEALETGVVKEDDIIFCENGKWRVYNHTINDSHELGNATVREVMVHSSNIGTAKIADKIGKKNLYERARLLGFGEVTGFDLPGETPGMLENPRNWSGLSLPTISYGQGVAVSPLQLVASYAAIANGGMLRSPKVIKSIRKSDGTVTVSPEKRDIRRAMKPETAARLTDILCEVVASGTGTSAAIPGVRIAGKTGTAQRVKEGVKGYAAGLYISSFMGFVADRDPRILCLVLIDSPKGVYYGSQVAAPVFRNIINRMLNMGDNLWISNEVAEHPAPPAPASELPDVVGLGVEKAISVLERKGFTVSVVGDPTVVAKQMPFPGAKLNIGATVTLYSNVRERASENSVLVPDLTGKTMREAVQQLVQANLKVSVDGTGHVKEQMPKAGTEVAYGTICTITCQK
jgi:stage V sporulation protein D (sporulation-specific penicillin-binding protein)